MRTLFLLGLAIPLAAGQNREGAPQGFEANHRLGEYYVARQELRAAIPYLRRAYRADPANYENAYDLALAFLKTGDLVGARRIIQELLKRQEKSELHNLMGDVEEASGRMMDAVREYEAAARMDPSEKNVFDLGSELLAHQGFEQGSKVLEFGAGRYPQSARMRVGLGVAYYSLGRYREAVESFCAAVDLDPKDTRALDFIGKMHSVAPELDDEVTRRLARFVKLYPENPLANYYYAVSLRNRGEAKQDEVAARAEALLLNATKLDPKLAEAHYQLGLLYEDRGQPAQAITEYEAAVRIRPELKPAHYRLARLYAAQGKADAAEKESQVFRSLGLRSP